MGFLFRICRYNKSSPLHLNSVVYVILTSMSTSPLPSSSVEIKSVYDKPKTKSFPLLHGPVSKTPTQNDKAIRDRQLQRWTCKLVRGFQPEDVAIVLRKQRDVSISYDIFRWASHQRRYKHNHLTYQVMMLKFSYARMIDKVDMLVQEVIDGACEGTESLFNCAIYIYIRNRQLGKAINVYKYMRNSEDCKPSVKTYNLLLSAMISKGTNSYISFMYLQNMRALFKQMMAANIAPDLFTLNLMIKGYALSLNVNDALRIFHQMGLYGCNPNAHTFNYIIRGLCLQNRTHNAGAFYEEMIRRGYVPTNVIYNCLVNCLAFNGEVDKATEVFREMLSKGGAPDFITYETLLHGYCKEGKAEFAKELLREFSSKDLTLKGSSYRKLLDYVEPCIETAEVESEHLSANYR